VAGGEIKTRETRDNRSVLAVDRREKDEWVSARLSLSSHLGAFFALRIFVRLSDFPRLSLSLSSAHPAPGNIRCGYEGVICRLRIHSTKKRWRGTFAAALRRNCDIYIYISIAMTFET